MDRMGEPRQCTNCTRMASMILNYPSEYQERIEPVPPFQIHITSYRIQDEYFCSVDNVDPGAVIARSKSLTREVAESIAISRAKAKLKKSRVNIKQETI